MLGTVWLGIKVIVISFLPFIVVEENPKTIEGETVFLLNDFSVWVLTCFNYSQAI